jgi:phytoene dehydrogenase-like protein
MTGVRSDEAEVLVIGAGVAGLRCAALLARAGREVRVWEASDDVGGRIRTDRVDGCLCDRGFQVLNPGYPELRCAVDVAALNLRPFGAGVAIRRERSSAVWAHPLRMPTRVPAMLTGGGVRPRDAVSVARWALPALRPRTLTSPGRADTKLVEALDEAHVGGELRRALDRFLAGVLLDDSGQTSNAFALLLARMFVLATPGLPADGMAALPRRLAAPIADRIRLNTRAVELHRRGREWRVAGSGGTIRTRYVVVATDPAVAAVLTGQPDPAMHGVVTYWWALDRPVPDTPFLWVDARAGRPGPVLNVSVIDAVAPSYAPPGRHLVAASTLLDGATSLGDEATARRHAADILGIPFTGWDLLVRNVIPRALPAQSAPLLHQRPVAVGQGLFVCGDHRDTASIQGALVSGRRAARAVLAASSAPSLTPVH